MDDISVSVYDAPLTYVNCKNATDTNSKFLKVVLKTTQRNVKRINKLWKEHIFNEGYTYENKKKMLFAVYIPTIFFF